MARLGPVCDPKLHPEKSYVSFFLRPFPGAVLFLVLCKELRHIDFFNKPKNGAFCQRAAEGGGNLRRGENIRLNPFPKTVSDYPPTYDTSPLRLPMPCHFP